MARQCSLSLGLDPSWWQVTPVLPHHLHPATLSSPTLYCRQCGLLAGTVVNPPVSFLGINRSHPSTNSYLCPNLRVRCNVCPYDALPNSPVQHIVPLLWTLYTVYPHIIMVYRMLSLYPQVSAGCELSVSRMFIWFLPFTPSESSI